MFKWVLHVSLFGLVGSRRADGPGNYLDRCKNNANDALTHSQKQSHNNVNLIGLKLDKKTGEDH